MVLFCPARTSRTWAVIEQQGRFCVNVLALEQEELCQRFGRSAPDKFSAVDWTDSTTGLPALSGAAAWIDCEIAEIHEAGDHLIVTGRVLHLEPGADGPRPLLFHRGRYAATEAPVVRRAVHPDLTSAPLAESWF
ncbi:flavin reductase family protein [Nocardioides sp.]|uniref:flavin reductase family protein n=1 Tax=Nocardioides sp. TaxID=35761 RepID=UPI0026252D1B|nr:flavin reductase family protein [Nocardioides sp.]